MNTKKLEQQNKILQKKILKYKHTYFGPIYLLSISLIYFVCQIFNVDSSLELFPNIQNSITFTLMGTIILGSMLGTCKIEYNKSIKKMQKKIALNNQKIRDNKNKYDKNKIVEKELSKLDKNQEADIELAKIKEQTKKMIIKLMDDEKNNLETFEPIDNINIEKIKEKILQKRLEK